MMQLIEFCFKDTQSGVATIIVLGVIFGGIASIIRAFRKNCKDEDDND